MRGPAILAAMTTPLPRPTRDPLAWAAGLPDAVTAGFFLLLWLFPAWLGAAALKTGLLMMLVEFILLHATAMIGGTLLSREPGQPMRWRALAGFSVLYLAFILAWCLQFQAWWPVLAFGWLLAGKAALAMQPVPVAAKRERLSSDWALGVIFYLGGVFATSVLPLPRLGLDRAVVAAADLPGSGQWVDRPHTVVAFGLVYFALLSVSKARGWKLPKSA